MIKSASRSSLVEDVKYTSMSAGVVPSNEYLIESRILDTAVSEITFNNLDQFAGTYRHLQIVASYRCSASTEGYLALQYNGVTTSSYRQHMLEGNGSTVTSSADGSAVSNSYLGVIPGTSQTGAWGAMTLDILDAYSTSKNKVLRRLSSGAWREITFGSGLFNSTAQVSSIRLFDIAGSNFLAGSRFSIYGVTA